MLLEGMYKRTLCQSLYIYYHLVIHVGFVFKAEMLSTNEQYQSDVSLVEMQFPSFLEWTMIEQYAGIQVSREVGK